MGALADSSASLGGIFILALAVAAWAADFLGLLSLPKHESATAFGTAEWADKAELRRIGLTGGQGLIVGRQGRRLLRLATDRHLLTLAPTRSGKGVSSIIPNLLTYPGSVFVVDVKGENAAITARRRFAARYNTRDWLLLNQLADSSSHPQITITTEQRLAIFNALRQQEGGAPLSVLYPDEGSYWQDYSLCASDADWVTPAHRAAIRQILNFLSTESAQMAATRRGFRPSILPFREAEPLTAANGIDPKLPDKSFTPLTPNSAQTLINKWGEIMRPNAVG